MNDNSKLYFAGIDIGSLSTDAVIINDKKNIISSVVIPTGASSITAGENAFKHILEKAKLKKEKISYLVATGYGRINIPFADKTITEITCHAVGAHHCFSTTETVIDIGGQDSKVIKLDKTGKIIDFTMNDKCAAGTGKFLEVMAKTLETNLSDLGKISLQAKKEITISSMCTVFAESEVVSLISKGESKEDIANGIHQAIAQRIINMVKQIGATGEITMTGGVAKNKGMVLTLEQKLARKINIPDEPQIIGAFGAALLAREKREK